MTVTTRFPTANEIETGGWTSPNNAHADDGVYATAGPAKNGVVGTRWKTFGFDGDIPSGATITQVQIIYEYKVNVTNSIATMRVRARINDVDEENHDDASEPTADTVVTVDITADRGWVRADLLDAALKITGEARRGNSNNAVTFSLDQIKVEVTYTTSTTYFFTLAATAIGVSGLARIATFPKTMAATAVGVATLSLASVIGITLAAVATGVATLSRVATFVKTFAATAVGVATMTRAATYVRTLAATAVGVPALVRKQFVALSATATGVATMADVLTLNIAQAATAVGVATLSRAMTFAKTLAATAVGVATLIKEFIAGSGGDDFPGARSSGASQSADGKGLI